MAHRWTAPDDTLNRLFRRCLECPNIQPSCPDCPKGTTCSLLPQTCNTCPSTQCVKVAAVQGLDAGTDSTPIGGIIGGVVGGVVGLIILTYLIWRFCIRKKKRQDLWVPPEKTPVVQPDTMLSRTHSIASTVMTRASNVIQIAYIPGVTVRSAPESPEIPPPMPSIPSAFAGTSAQTSPEVEQHFFMPKDLRDSVWSDASSVMTDQRVSIAPSLARASVYQENAVVPPIPAQYAYRAQANAVSVRSGNSTPSMTQGENTTPPIPQMPQITKAINISGSSIVARNVVAKPIEVNKVSSANSSMKLSPFPKKTPSRRATPVPAISDEKEVVFSSPSSTLRTETSPVPTGGPVHSGSFMSMDYTSASSTPAVTPDLGNTGSLSARPTTAYTQAMIHEAMFRATQDTTRSNVAVQRPPLAKHDSGPFSDANEIR